MAIEDDKIPRPASRNIAAETDHLAVPEPHKRETSKTFDNVSGFDEHAKEEVRNRRFRTPDAREQASTLEALTEEALADIDAAYEEELKAYKGAPNHDNSKLWSPEYAQHYNKQLVEKGRTWERERARELKTLEAGLTRIENEQYSFVLSETKLLGSQMTQGLLIYVPPERERQDLSAAWDRAAERDRPVAKEKSEEAQAFDRTASPFSRNETGISRGELTVADSGRTL